MGGKLDNKIMKQISESPFPYGIVMLFCVFVIVDIIMFQIDNIHYCLIVAGKMPYVGGTGVILFILTCYVCWCGLYIIISRIFFIKRNFKLLRRIFIKLLSIILLILPFVGLLIYCDFYSSRSDSLETKYIKQSHKCLGIVYSKESPGSRSHHYTFRTGVDSIHTREQRISEDSPLIKSIHVGDTIILRVSDEYPRVNRVLNWQPTPEEIEKYKTPVRLIEKNR